jgi:hypothetical protein
VDSTKLHIVDRGKEKSHYTVSDFIKQLITKTNTPFVLSGIPRARSLMVTNEQLGDRFGELIPIRVFTSEVGKSNSIAKAMKVFKVALGDLDCIDLASDDNSRKMAFATAGRLRGMRRLLVRAVKIAFESEAPRIDLPVLSRAFEEVIFADCPADRNPFDEKFDGYPLIRSGEPYATLNGETYGAR